MGWIKSYKQIELKVKDVLVPNPHPFTTHRYKQIELKVSISSDVASRQTSCYKQIELKVSRLLVLRLLPRLWLFVLYRLQTDRTESLHDLPRKMYIEY